MDFLRDPRFSQYRKSTTMTKYFPINHLSQSQAKQNFIYQILKSCELTQQQKQQQFFLQQQNNKRQRKSTLLITQVKFLQNKTFQRLKTINSFVQLKKVSSYKLQSTKCCQKNIDGVKNDLLRLNLLGEKLQKFHKSLTRDKHKVNILKKYNNIVQSHFDKFQINQDRTRKEIKDHENIINLLRKDQNTEHNLLDVESLKQNRNSELKPCSLHQNSKPKESVRKCNSFFSDTKLNQYTSTNHCQKKISKVFQQYRQKNNTSLKKRYINSLHSDKMQCRPSACKNQKPARKQQQSRFQAQYLKKSHRNKQNKVPISFVNNLTSPYPQSENKLKKLVTQNLSFQNSHSELQISSSSQQQCSNLLKQSNQFSSFENEESIIENKSSSSESMTKNDSQISTTKIKSYDKRPFRKVKTANTKNIRKNYNQQYQMYTIEVCC